MIATGEKPAIKIEMGAGAWDAKVWIDGNEITQYVTGIRVASEGGDLTRVSLDLIGAECVVQADADTAKILREILARVEEEGGGVDT